MANSVGIGEHPQQVEEAMKALDKLAASTDKIKNLEDFFGPDPQTGGELITS
jgi:hypothetical protein